MFIFCRPGNLRSSNNHCTVIRAPANHTVHWESHMIHDYGSVGSSRKHRTESLIIVGIR